MTIYTVSNLQFALHTQKTIWLILLQNLLIIWTRKCLVDPRKYFIDSTKLFGCFHQIRIFDRFNHNLFDLIKFSTMSNKLDLLVQEKFFSSRNRKDLQFFLLYILSIFFFFPKKYVLQTFRAISLPLTVIHRLCAWYLLLLRISLIYDGQTFSFCDRYLTCFDKRTGHIHEHDSFEVAKPKQNDFSFFENEKSLRKSRCWKTISCARLKIAISIEIVKRSWKYSSLLAVGSSAFALRPRKTHRNFIVDQRQSELPGTGNHKFTVGCKRKDRIFSLSLAISRKCVSRGHRAIGRVPLSRFLSLVEDHPPYIDSLSISSRGP